MNDTAHTHFVADSDAEKVETFTVPNRADRRRHVTRGTHRMPSQTAKLTGAHWASGLYLRRVLSGQALRLQAIRDRWDLQQIPFGDVVDARQEV